MTSYLTDPALYIFTSLTAGSSHIVTATSRLETILRANRVPFKAVDIATDEKARRLWGRRAGKDDGGRPRKLPGLVQEGMVIGDLVEIEDWNEYGELKQHVKIYYDEYTIPNMHNKPPEPKRLAKPAAKPAVPTNTPVASKAAAPPAPPLPEAKPSSGATAPKPGDKPVPAGKQTTTALPIRSVADEAAQKAKELRLKSLREKVQGKQAGDGNGDNKSATGRPKTPDAAYTPQRGQDKALDGEATKPAGLQSPTSGAWKSHSPGGRDSLAETAQSPRSGKWRPRSLVCAATGHDGAVEGAVGVGETGGEGKIKETEKETLQDAEAHDVEDEKPEQRGDSAGEGPEQTKVEPLPTADSKDDDGAAGEENETPEDAKTE
ncbi:hypothetical protein E4U41_006175 [Claviceps citrina]|nr:hypothetical protein E4U41_006175 [Claviceps citrina]